MPTVPASRPDTESLYWDNATEQLLAARRERRVLKSLMIDEARVLDDGTGAAFVVAARHYLSRYRGNQALPARIGGMAGVEFEASDIVLHFVNEHGEDLNFWQRQGEGYATLLHSDLDWEPEFIGPEMLHFDTSLSLRGLGPVSTVGAPVRLLRQGGPTGHPADVAAGDRRGSPARTRRHRPLAESAGQ